MKQVHKIKRRVSKKIFVGNVAIGGDAPISVQSMTNTDTLVMSTLQILQILSLLKKRALILLGFQFQLWRQLKPLKKLKKRVNITIDY